MKSSKLVLVCLLLVAVGLVVSATTASARPFSPGYFVHTQADGSKIVISMAGSDEAVRFAQTADGYTLLDDGKGNYVYAVQDAKGNLVKSKMKAHDMGKRGASEKSFAGKLAKGLAFTAAQRAAMRPTPKKPKGLGTQLQLSPYGFPSTGSALKHLVIAVDFPNFAWTLSMTSLGNAMNQQGYQSPEEGQTGSFKDFYKENSYNQQVITTTVVGPYRMAHDFEYYGTDGQYWDTLQGEMITEAIEAAYDDGVNFSTFDNDNNGWCDSIGVAFAGYGEQGGADNTHLCISCSSLYCQGQPILRKNGVQVCCYYIFPEYRGASGTEQEAIASATHEFGHGMWLNDTYVTPNWPMQCWDQMAMGSWGGGWGDSPTHHCAYGKVRLGWYTPTTLSTTGTGKTLQPAETNAGCYKIGTGTSNQYFLFENRQQTGFDSVMPGHGMLAMQVGGTYEVALRPADNDMTCNTAGMAGDPFPGTSSITSITETTTPSLKSWSGVYYGNNVTNISENSGVIGFDFTRATPAGGTNYSCDSVVLDKGTLASGTHSSTHASDNTYMQVTAAKSGNKYNAQETYTFDTGVTANLLYLEVVVEASVNTGSQPQTVLIYNPTSATWVSMGATTLTTTDSTFLYRLRDPNNYKTAAGQIKLQVQILNSTTAFTHKTDYVNIYELH